MKRIWIGGLAAALGLALTGGLGAHAPSGAIFTTLPDGSAVNYNIYPSKFSVYLDGGPGQNAPIDAAGLDEGDYVFQVTSPSGKALLSTDLARCRMVHVNANGVISAFIGGSAASCNQGLNGPLALGEDGNHKLGFDADHGAVTVQLMPYLDTPNPGGEYKVWMTRLEDFLLGCQAMGFAGTSGLDVVACDGKVRGNAHGFIPSHSKTDNVKAGGDPREIDTRFHEGSLYGPFIDGLSIKWTDPRGGSNIKWSYLDVAHDVNHEAHVENVEDGTHIITVANQLGCRVGEIAVAGSVLPKKGPQNVSVQVKPSWRGETIFVDVACLP